MGPAASPPLQQRRSVCAAGRRAGVRLVLLPHCHGCARRGGRRGFARQRDWRMRAPDSRVAASPLSRSRGQRRGVAAPGAAARARAHASRGQGAFLPPRLNLDPPSCCCALTPAAGARFRRLSAALRRLSSTSTAWRRSSQRPPATRRRRGLTRWIGNRRRRHDGSASCRRRRTRIRRHDKRAPRSGASGRRRYRSRCHQLSSRRIPLWPRMQPLRCSTD